MKPIIPNLWFDQNAEEAVNFYVSVFPNSKIGSIMRYGESGAKVSGMPAGSVMTVDFELNGQRFIAINGGPVFKFTEAVSFLINCESQEEMNSYYDRLSAVPASEQCGWVKDKYGLSWQITSQEIEDLARSGDAEKVERMMAAMLSMKRLDVAALKQAYEEA